MPSAAEPPPGGNPGDAADADGAHEAASSTAAGNTGAPQPPNDLPGLAPPPDGAGRTGGKSATTSTTRTGDGPAVAGDVPRPLLEEPLAGAPLTASEGFGPHMESHAEPREGSAKSAKSAKSTKKRRITRGTKVAPEIKISLTKLKDGGKALINSAKELAKGGLANGVSVVQTVYAFGRKAIPLAHVEDDANTETGIEKKRYSVTSSGQKVCVAVKDYKSEVATDLELKIGDFILLLGEIDTEDKMVSGQVGMVSGQVGMRTGIFPQDCADEITGYSQPRVRGRVRVRVTGYSQPRVITSLAFFKLVPKNSEMWFARQHLQILGAKHVSNPDSKV